MISDTKPQNIILALALIAGVLSAFSMANTAGYYTGTVYLIENMDVEFQGVRLTNFDSTNRSVIPTLRLDFRFFCNATQNGSVVLTTIGAEVHVNSDILSYTSFYKNQVNNPELYAGYNQSHSLIAQLNEEVDRNTVFDAYESGTWSISIVFRYFYVMFNSPSDSFDIKVYDTSEVTVTGI
ncbi:MAG: hypothetical protein RTU30_09845 [Candidatus Thorarchaeota archaeon]